MIKIRLIWVGKTQLPFMQEGVKIYLKKLSSYVTIDLVEIPSSKYLSKEVYKSRLKETEKIMSKLNFSELNIFLDENGNRETSMGFAKWLEKQIDFAIPRVNFIIGGAYGFEKSIIPENIYYMSLSDMTYTHQMVRLVLIEQIYRALKIIRKEPYHHI